MKKYEYVVIEHIDSSCLQKNLDKVSENGWRCVSVLPGEISGYQLVLEKEI